MPESVTVAVLQAQVMRFADTYVAIIAQACDDVTANTTNPDLRLAVLQWKVGQATSAYTDATGQNPALNALDMLVLVTMARMVVEDYGVKTYGDDVLPLLDKQRELETDAWTLAEGVLRPAQQQELRDLIQAWRAKNPHQRFIGPIRFRELVTAVGKTPTQATTGPTSLFSLLYLDPLAGLDPTAAAIQETREMGERAMFYTQRMPQLLSWQTEVLAYQLAEQPESRQVLSNAQQLASSAQSFARTTEQLPQLVNDQRQAAIQQIFDGLNSNSADMRQTLGAGGEAAAAINTAIKSLDEFVRYVSPTNTGPVSASTSSRPFNVLDYGTAASQIGTAANNLNALLTTISQSAPQLTQLGRQTAAESNRVVDRAFQRGLILILILLIGAVVAGLAYRILANKLIGHKSSGPDLEKINAFMSNSEPRQLQPGGYNLPLADASLIACPHCDLLQRIPEITLGASARCPRCDRELWRRREDSLNRTFALTLAALVLYVIANSVPMLGLTAAGHEAFTTVIGGARQLWNSNQQLVAVLVLFAAVVSPALQIGFLLLILIGCRFERPPVRVGTLLRHLPMTRTWSMIEVMLLGVMVALTKIADYATVILGTALFALFALVVLLAAIQSCFDPREVWKRVEWANAEARRPEAAETGGRMRDVAL